MAVNKEPNVLNDLILLKLTGAAKIAWLSPLAKDSFAEYRDGKFLKLIGAESLAPKLAKFWPRRGPQWDGLALSDAGDVLLIEAKAHIGELCSPATQASQSSRRLIQKSLRATATYVKAKPCTPWSGAFYQLANRLAHLYFLRRHGVKAWLVLINFIGDEDMGGPKSEAEWNAAYKVVWHVLGIGERHRLPPMWLKYFRTFGRSYKRSLHMDTQSAKTLPVPSSANDDPHKSRRRHLTQWAAQFAVAGELCKRGYEVAFTMGNTTPEADLMVVPPDKNKMFLVDVKGQSTKSFWRIREQKRERKNLFYVLAYVPLRGPNRFFVIPQKMLAKLMNEYEHSGIKFDPRFSGVNWTTPVPFENKWDTLPK